MTSFQHFVPENIPFKKNVIRVEKDTNEEFMEESENDILVFAETLEKTLLLGLQTKTSNVD